MINTWLSKIGGGTECNYLSLENTNCLKGIFAATVVIHHLYQRTDFLDIIILKHILQFAGYLSVAMFFFLSGYGLMLSYKSKGREYINSFPRRRILPFYCNCVILTCLYLSYKYWLYGALPTVKSLITSFSWGGTVVGYGWYLQATLVIYLLFYVIFNSVLDNGKKIALFGLALIFYCIVCSSLEYDATIYQSVFAVVSGMLWYFWKDKIDIILEKRYIKSLVVSFMSFAVALVMTKLVPILSIVFVMLSAVAFPCFVVVLLKKVRIKNKITQKLGKYYFEIYVTQSLVMNLFKSRVVNIENDILYCMVCIVGIGLLSILLNPIFTTVNDKFKQL